MKHDDIKWTGVGCNKTYVLLFEYFMTERMRIFKTCILLFEFLFDFHLSMEIIVSWVS